MKLVVALLVVFSLALAHGNVIPDTAPFERSPEEGDLFEGDIAGVTLVHDGRGAAQIVTASRVKWPNGVVPYVFDSVYCKSLRSNWRAARLQVSSSWVPIFSFSRGSQGHLLDRHEDGGGPDQTEWPRLHQVRAANGREHLHPGHQ